MNVIPFPVRQPNVLQKKEKKSEAVTIRVGDAIENFRFTHSDYRDFADLAANNGICFSEAFRRALLYFRLVQDGILTEGLFFYFMKNENAKFREEAETRWYHSIVKHRALFPERVRRRENQPN